MIVVPWLNHGSRTGMLEVLSLGLEVKMKNPCSLVWKLIGTKRKFKPPGQPNDTRLHGFIHWPRRQVQHWQTLKNGARPLLHESPGLQYLADIHLSSNSACITFTSSQFCFMVLTHGRWRHSQATSRCFWPMVPATHSLHTLHCPCLKSDNP